MSTVSKTKSSRTSTSQQAVGSRGSKPRVFIGLALILVLLLATLEAGAKQKSRKHQEDEETADAEADEEPTTERPIKRVRPKPFDLSKVKLVGAKDSHPSSTARTTTKPQSTAAPTTTSSTTTTTSTTTAAPAKPDNESLGLPAIHVSHEEPEDEEHEESTELQSSGAANSLDSRSPVAQPTGFGKKLSHMIAESKSKLMRPTSAPSSASSSKFGYSKVNSSSTMMSLLEQATTTPSNFFVQVVNGTSPGDAVVLANSSAPLDWSKLVKVVFKSAKDNQTIYTVITNSSELSHHPINDWSNELPKLLQRDFEKLVQKWSNVFPVDNLMTDLGQIIVNKVTTSPSNISIPASILSKLNSTNLAPQIQSLSFSGNISTFEPSKLATKAAELVSNSSARFPLPASTNATILTNQTTITTTSTSTTTTTTPRPVASVTESGRNLTEHAKNQTNTMIYDSNLNSLMTNSSPRPSEKVIDVTRSQMPPSSSTSLSISTKTMQTNETSTVAGTNATFGQQKTDQVQATTKTVAESSPIGATQDAQNVSAKSLLEAMRDIKAEHHRIEDDVKEQASSLRHFIILCSISVVIATSLVVGLVIVLFK